MSFQFTAATKHGDGCPWMYNVGNTKEQGLTLLDQYGISGAMYFVFVQLCLCSVKHSTKAFLGLYSLFQC